METSNVGPLFREEQQFRQPWLWLMLALTMVPVTILLIFGMVSQIVFDKPWGDDDLSDVMLTVVGTGAIAFMLLLLFLFYVMTLVVEVREDGVRIRLFPIFGRWVPFRDIESYEARSYSPLREYGGWGIRWSPSKGWAFNISGNSGVQFSLSRGRNLLIGSQRADELEAAIRHGMGVE